MKFNKFNYMFIFIFLLFSSITIADIGSDLDNSLYDIDRLDDGSIGYYNESHSNTYIFDQDYSNIDDFLTNNDHTIQYLLDFSDLTSSKHIYLFRKGGTNIVKVSIEEYSSTQFVITNYVSELFGDEYTETYYVNKNQFNTGFNLITIRNNKDTSFELNINYDDFNLNIYRSGNTIDEKFLDFVGDQFSEIDFYISDYYSPTKLDDLRLWDKYISDTELNYIYNDNNYLTYPFYRNINNQNYIKNILYKNNFLINLSNNSFYNTNKDLFNVNINNIDNENITTNINNEIINVTTNKYIYNYNYSINFNHNYTNENIANLNYNINTINTTKLNNISNQYLKYDDNLTINLSDYYLNFNNITINDFNNDFENSNIKVNFSYGYNNGIINISSKYLDFNNINLSLKVCLDDDFCLNDEIKIYLLTKIDDVGSILINKSNSIYLHLNSYYNNFNEVEILFNDCGILNKTNNELNCYGYNTTLINNSNEFYLYLENTNYSHSITFYNESINLTFIKYDKNLYDKINLTIYNIKPLDWISINGNIKFYDNYNGSLINIIPFYNDPLKIELYSYNATNSSIINLLDTFYIEDLRNNFINYSINTTKLNIYSPMYLFKISKDGFYSLNTTLLILNNSIKNDVNLNMNRDINYEKTTYLFEFDFNLQNTLFISLFLILSIISVFLLKYPLNLFGAIGVIGVGFILLFNEFNLFISFFVLILGFLLIFKD